MSFDLTMGYPGEGPDYIFTPVDGNTVSTGYLVVGLYGDWMRLSARARLRLRSWPTPTRLRRHRARQGGPQRRFQRHRRRDARRRRPVHRRRPPHAEQSRRRGIPGLQRPQRGRPRQSTSDLAARSWWCCRLIVSARGHFAHCAVPRGSRGHGRESGRVLPNPCETAVETSVSYRGRAGTLSRVSWEERDGGDWQPRSTDGHCHDAWQ
mmetsp:Transcript_40222/g.129203  ORF Transcript_40222/g.129203 Transcript_40222/m.129203 type:complete len:208 (+) Transcript_40222:660-1283(+)